MAEDCVELGFEEHVIDIRSEGKKHINPKFKTHKNIFPNLLLGHCISCSEPLNNRRRFNLKNRKCLEEDLFEKLQMTLGDINLVRTLYKCRDATICRICLRKISFVCSFLKTLKRGVKAYVVASYERKDFDKDQSEFRLSEDLTEKTSEYYDSDSSETDGSINGGAEENPCKYVNPGWEPASPRDEYLVDHGGRSGDGWRKRKMQAGECADVEMTEDVTESKSCFLQAIPMEHSYSRSTPQRPVIEIDSSSTDSASENEMTNMPIAAKNHKSFMQKQNLKKDQASVKPLPNVVQPVDKPESGKSEVKLIISSDDSKAGTYKISIGGVSFSRKVADVSNVTTRPDPITAKTSKRQALNRVDNAKPQTASNSAAVTDDEKFKHAVYKTPYRHLESVERFGEVKDVSKGSQVVDLTKQREASGMNWTQPSSDKELRFPLNWDNWLPSLQKNTSLEESKFYAALERAVLYRNMTDLMSTLLSHREIKRKMRQSYIECVMTECQSLCTPKHVKNCTSVLMRCNSLSQLGDIKDFVAEIFAEIKSRCPYLLDILVGVTGALPTSLPVEYIGPITSAYAVLMKARCMSMTGWHKMVQCLLDHGYVESRMLVVLNHLGILTGPVSKFRLLENISLDRQCELAHRLKNYPLAKVIVDISTRPSGQLETENNEMQVVVSSLILAKDVDESLDSTELPFPDKIPSTTFLPSTESLDKLQSAYAVLIGRIIKDLPGLSWLRVPDHIPHSRSEWSAQQTEIHPLITAFCFETRRNDGVKVLQTLQDSLDQLYTKCADGCGDSKRPPVPIGGDQLSRAQLEFVRSKKIPKVSQKERFKHLGPNITEFWHNKKDFVVKAYKALYNKKSFNEPGTLYYFKSKMQLAFVTENFDKNFDAHHDLLLHLGRSLIQEQAIEYFGLDPETGTDTRNIPENINIKSEGEKRRESEKVLKDFVQHYGYATMVFKDFNQKRYEMRTETGNQILVEMPENGEEDEDEVYNYCMQLTHWTLHLLEMEDTAREGDGDRLVVNSQYSLPFFYSFSPFSNQLTEIVDFLIKVKHTLSPQMKELVLRTAFVNLEGEEGKCCEADLAHEKITRNQRSLVKHMDGLATDRMVKGVAAAADIVCKIADNAAHSLRILKRKTKASHKLSDKQIELIRITLRNLRPFNKEPGRVCLGFKGVHAFPFQKVNRLDMFQRLDRIVGRLRRGVGLGINEEEEDVIMYVPEPVVKRKRAKKTLVTPRVTAAAATTSASTSDSTSTSKINPTSPSTTNPTSPSTTNPTSSSTTNSTSASTTNSTSASTTNSTPPSTTNSTSASMTTSGMSDATIVVKSSVPTGSVQVIHNNVPIDPDILSLLKPS